jgi:hypothetical protein
VTVGVIEDRVVDELVGVLVVSVGVRVLIVEVGVSLGVGVAV